MTTAAPIYMHPTNPGYAQFLSGDTITVPGSIALATMTQGSILFAGASGVVSQDNAQLFWDDTNNRLGIGIAVPTGKVHIVQAAVATGAATGIVYTGAANTNQTLSTEIPSVTITTTSRQWATGAIATQREVVITQPTYSFVGGSTITDAATLGIAGAPKGGANATMTRSHGLLIQAGDVSGGASCPASYGVFVNAQTGATSNYAAQFVGASGAGAVLMVAQSTPTATGAIRGIVYTGYVNTNQTLSTEIAAVTVTTAGRQWATGAIATQREFLITEPTYSFVGASVITDAATLAVRGAPVSHTNATITSSHGILVQSVDVTNAGACTASYGITVNAMTGATANYAGAFLGGAVGFMTTTPDAYITVNPTATANGLTALHVGSGIHTASTAGTEKPQVLLEGGGREWATGALVTQRAIKITAPTAYFVGGSTLTDAATVGITGAYAAGTNATITRSHGLLIESNNVNAIGVAVTSAYGLTVNAPTGATSNYAAQIVGASGAGAVLMVSQAAATATGAIRGIVYTGSINTNQTLSTEIPSVRITTAGRQWATGAIATQREVLIEQPVYSFVGASVITDAATLAIEAAPNGAANATITNSHALLIQRSLGVATVTNSYGLTCKAQDGGTHNYSAVFLEGNVGINTVAPDDAKLVIYYDSAAYDSTNNNPGSIQLQSSDTNGDYSGIEFTNVGSNRHALFGVFQGGATDVGFFVWQGWMGTSHKYEQLMQLTDEGQLAVYGGIGAWQHAAPAAQPATPAGTDAQKITDIIALLQGCGLCS